MNINYKQSQFELFPGSPGSSTDTEKPRFLLTNFTLSLENLVVAAIMMMMVVIFFFSLGVERGKIIAAMPSAVVTKTKIIKAQPAGQAHSQTAVPAAALPRRNQGNLPQGVQGNVPANIPVNIQEKSILPVATEIVKEDAVSDMSGKYTIQVASFKQEKYAQAEADTLKKKGFESLVVTKGSYSIVCIGSFNNKDDAKSFSRKIKNQYKDFVVRRL